MLEVCRNGSKPSLNPGSPRYACIVAFLKFAHAIAKEVQLFENSVSSIEHIFTETQKGLNCTGPLVHRFFFPINLKYNIAPSIVG